MGDMGNSESSEQPPPPAQPPPPMPDPNGIPQPKTYKTYFKMHQIYCFLLKILYQLRLATRRTPPLIWFGFAIRNFYILFKFRIIKNENEKTKENHITECIFYYFFRYFTICFVFYFLFVWLDVNMQPVRIWWRVRTSAACVAVTQNLTKIKKHINENLKTQTINESVVFWLVNLKFV